MTCTLDQLLAEVDPARTLDEVAARADEALNTFSYPSERPQDWENFKTELVRFMHHVETRILRLRCCVQANPDFDWGRCSRWLLLGYGLSGEKTAFDMARTGQKGGIYAVFKALAGQMAQEYTNNEISGRVYHYWNALSAEEQLAVTSEYLNKFGHLLPPELTEGSAVRVRTNLPKVLQEHTRLVQELRRVGR